MWLCESATRVPHASPLNPPNTTEWITPRRAHASMVMGNSGTMGMWMVTRSPAFRPQKSRSSAANSFTRTYSSRYVTDTGASFSGSGTKIIAALFLYLARCRSMQLYEALILPPTNHFQNGGSLVSSVLSQYLSHVSRSAYSRKHSG